MVHSELTLRVAGKLVKVQHDDTNLIVSKISSKFEIPLRQVLAAEYIDTSRTLKISCIRKRRRNLPYSLCSIEGEVLEVTDEHLNEWTEGLLSSAYDGTIKRGRKLKVIINPFGGVGKGLHNFNSIAEPILRAAGCELDIVKTTHSGHAFEIARALPLDFDAVVTVSGDGVIHEVMNGFADHEDPLKAFSIPVAPIPAGSGNGLSLNLLGIKHGFDFAVAALNVIKGSPMKVDVFSLTQNGKRTISFMSQAVGLMADLDIGTENLRWMGDIRFVIGLARGVISFKPCPVQLSYKTAEADKEKMAEALQAWRRARETAVLDPLSASASERLSGPLPPTVYSATEDEGWITLNEPLLYVYAGKGPYVSRDLMAFPVSLPDDGLIDIVAFPLSTRKAALSTFFGAAEGEPYWCSDLQYVKAHAYRIRPLTNKGTLSVDGESFPFEEFVVEAHKGLATLLSPYGYYAANFHQTQHEKHKRI